MDAKRYAQILGQSLILFIGSCFPEDHRFQQDNDPKDYSKYVEKYFQDNGINWWRTPPESPDLNPIELVRGSLKQYLRNHKPKNLSELQEGISTFWQTLTPAVCRRYINHLRKVIPKVTTEEGGSSSY